MKQKAVRITAIIALIFMGIFSASLILVFLGQTILGAAAWAIATGIAIGSGAAGLGLWVVIKILTKEKKPESEQMQDSETGLEDLKTINDKTNNE